MTKEKRRHGRFPLVLAASWDGAGNNSQARTTDISVTGCFIDSLGQVLVGETHNFKLIPPDGEDISVEGKIIYQQPGLGFGVRFTKISDADRLRLDALLAED
jgi:hypothetical protein